MRQPSAIAECIEESLGFGQSDLRSLDITVLASEQADVCQRAGVELSVARSALEQPLLPSHALRVTAPIPPVPAQIDRHAERRARVALPSPGERGVDAVVVVIQAF